MDHFSEFLPALDAPDAAPAAGKKIMKIGGKKILEKSVP
jgi:hypothetical protein